MSIARAVCYAALIAATGAQAASPKFVMLSGITGETLNGPCTSRAPNDGSVFDPCTSHMLGLVDGFSVGDKSCRPDAVENRQIVAVVKKFLADNPTRWDWPAVSNVEVPLAPWRCARSKPG